MSDHLDMAGHPVDFSFWQHKGNGNEYQVIGTLNADAKPENAEKYPVTVAYRGKNGLTWCKTLDNFLAKMKPSERKHTVFDYGEPYWLPTLIRSPFTNSYSLRRTVAPRKHEYWDFFLAKWDTVQHTLNAEELESVIKTASFSTLERSARHSFHGTKTFDLPDKELPAVILTDKVLVPEYRELEDARHAAIFAALYRNIIREFAVQNLLTKGAPVRAVKVAAPVQKLLSTFVDNGWVTHSHIHGRHLKVVIEGETVVLMVPMSYLFCVGDGYFAFVFGSSGGKLEVTASKYAWQKAYTIFETKALESADEI